MYFSASWGGEMSFATGVAPSHSLSNAEDVRELSTVRDAAVTTTVRAGVMEFRVDDEMGEDREAVEVFFRGRLVPRTLSSSSLSCSSLTSLRPRFEGVWDEKDDTGMGEGSRL